MHCMSRYYYCGGHSNSSLVRGNVKLLNVTGCKYGSDWHSVPHAHNYMELFYITGGKGQFLIHDQSYPVDTNDLVMINPNVPHTETGVKSKPLEYIVLGISGVELASTDSFNGHFLILNHFENRELTTCIHNILREMEQKNPGYEEVCQAYAEILIIRLMRNIAISAGGEPQGISDNPQCAAVKRYMDLHFKESLTLEQLAAEAHMNKFYLAHAFKREYGVSPIHYLISLRIEESKYLLTETDLTMSQIAQILGFSSPSYFSQVFRKTQGTSPMDYRHNPKNKSL